MGKTEIFSRCFQGFQGGGNGIVGAMKNIAPLQEGGLPFWGFSVAMIWRGDNPTGLWV